MQCIVPYDSVQHGSEGVIVTCIVQLGCSKNYGNSRKKAMRNWLRRPEIYLFIQDQIAHVFVYLSSTFCILSVLMLSFILLPLLWSFLHMSRVTVQLAQFMSRRSLLSSTTGYSLPFVPIIQSPVDTESVLVALTVSNPSSVSFLV